MKKVIAVVFQNDRPWSVTTQDEDGIGRNTYDVNYCESDGELYFQLSGGGGFSNDKVFIDGSNSNYWLAPGYTPRFHPGDKGKRLLEIKDEFKKHPEEYGIEEETVFCSKCDDHIPTGDEPPCDHVHWDEDIGWWNGEGYDG